MNNSIKMLKSSGLPSPGLVLDAANDIMETDEKESGIVLKIVEGQTRRIDKQSEKRTLRTR